MRFREDSTPTLLAQVTSMGSPDDFECISRDFTKTPDDLLGNIVKVTPTSKAVGDLAIFMYKNGLTKDNILDRRCRIYPIRIPSYQYFQGATWDSRMVDSRRSCRRLS